MHAKSNQTHVMSFEDCSGQWIFQHHRTRKAKSAWVTRLLSQTSRPNTKSSRTKKEFRRQTDSGRAPQRPGYGGAWRAWVRMKRDSPAIAPALRTQNGAGYQAARRNNTDDFKKAVELGKHATCSGRRTRTHGFGGSIPRLLHSQQILARAISDTQVLQWGHDKGSPSIALASYCRAALMTVADALKMARAANRSDTRRKRKLQELEQAAVANFQAGEGDRRVQAAKRPSLLFADSRWR